MTAITPHELNMALFNFFYIEHLDTAQPYIIRIPRPSEDIYNPVDTLISGLADAYNYIERKAVLLGIWQKFDSFRIAVSLPNGSHGELPPSPPKFIVEVIEDMSLDHTEAYVLVIEMLHETHHDNISDYNRAALHHLSENEQLRHLHDNQLNYLTPTSTEGVFYYRTVACWSERRKDKVQFATRLPSLQVRLEIDL